MNSILKIFNNNYLNINNSYLKLFEA